MKTYTACIGKDLQCVRVNLFSEQRTVIFWFTLKAFNVKLLKAQLKNITIKL